jgi:SAM-dependent methyltransferase
MCLGNCRSALRRSGYEEAYLSAVGSRQWYTVWSNLHKQGERDEQQGPHAASPAPDIKAALDLVGARPGETVIDLGSGSGDVLLVAARRGCRAIGIERDPYYVNLSRRRVILSGLADRVTIRRQAIAEADLSTADMVYVYLSPADTQRLAAKLRTLRPGVRIVSRLHAIPGLSGSRYGDLYLYRVLAWQSGGYL